MASRKYSSRTTAMSNEFIYINLLPRVKRPRNFDVNLLLIVLFAVIVSWILVYIPISARQDTLDDVLASNKALSLQLILTNEEISGRNVSREHIGFAEYVRIGDEIPSEFFIYFDNFESMIVAVGGSITVISYNNITNIIVMEVLMIDAFARSKVESLNYDFIDLPVVNSSYMVIKSSIPENHYRVEYTIEVNTDAQ